MPLTEEKLVLKYYLSRYIDINKCAEVKRLTTCLDCGWDLEGRHFTDFESGLVKEVLCCPQCHENPKVLEHSLH